MQRAMAQEAEALREKRARLIKAQAEFARPADIGLTPADIDLIVLATSTPNHTFPATAVEIQQRLGMRHGFAFDMQAVCSGFVYGIAVTDALLLGSDRWPAPSTARTS